MSLYRVVCGVLVLAWTLQAAAQPAPDMPRLDLDALIAEALTRHPALEVARTEAAARAQQAPQVGAWPDPMASLMILPWPVFTAKGAQRSQWRIEQTIPTRAKPRLRANIAELYANEAEASTQALALDLTLQVRLAYWQMYRVYQLDALLTDFQLRLRSFEEAAAVKYEVGQGTQQAILKAQLEHNLLAMQHQRLAEDRATAVASLAELLHRPDTSGLRLRFEKPLPLPTPDTAWTQVLAQRPEAEALRLAEARAAQQADLAARSPWPDVTVSLTYLDIADSSFPAMATGRDAVMLGVGVRVPWHRERLHAERQEAILRQQQAQAQIDVFANTTRAQLADLSARMTQQQKQLRLLTDTLIPQAETTLEATLSAYTTGRTDFLDLLDAERTLFTLQSTQVETSTRLYQTQARYLRALGISTNDDE